MAYKGGRLFLVCHLDLQLLNVPLSSHSSYSVDGCTLSPWCFCSAKSGPGTPPSLPPSFRQAFSTFYILAGLVTMLFDSNNRMWGSQAGAKGKAACVWKSPNVCHLICVQNGTLAKLMTFLYFYPNRERFGQWGIQTQSLSTAQVAFGWYFVMSVLCVADLILMLEEREAKRLRLTALGHKELRGGTRPLNPEFFSDSISD